MGVGALAAATVRHYRRPEASAKPRLVGVEPLSADRVLASLRAGRPVTIPGPYDSMHREHLAPLQQAATAAVVRASVGVSVDRPGEYDGEYSGGIGSGIRRAGVYCAWDSLRGGVNYGR